MSTVGDVNRFANSFRGLIYLMEPPPEGQDSALVLAVELGEQIAQDNDTEFGLEEFDVLPAETLLGDKAESLFIGLRRRRSLFFQTLHRDTPSKFSHAG